MNCENEEDEDVISVRMETEEQEEKGGKKTEKKKKMKRKPGVVYLSTIPLGMDVQSVRNIFAKYGALGRMYLQPYPEKNRGGGVGKTKPLMKKKKRHQNYCEGWVEFLDKKTAKMVAAELNNKLIGGKRKSKFYDYIWNIKYLHRFKWVHLSERVAYEKASHLQRMRTEIAQVKKETDYYVESVEKSRNEIEFRRRHPGARQSEPMVMRQRETDEEIRKRKQDLGLTDDSLEPDLTLLQSVFGSR